MNAQTIPEKPRGMVNDMAALLSTDETAKLNEKLITFYNQHRIPLYIYILHSMEQYSIDEFAIEVYKTWKKGNSDLVNGALLFVAIKDKKIYIQVSPANSKYFPDTLTTRLIDTYLRPPFRIKNYFKGFDEISKQLLEISKKLHGKKSEIVMTPKQPVPAKEKTKSEIISKPVKPVIPPAPTLHFYDYAGLLTAEQLNEMENKLESFFEKDSIPIYTMTYFSADTSYLRMEIPKWFNQWKSVQPKLEFGFMLIIIIKEKKLILRVDSSRQEIFHDSTASRLISTFLKPAFRAKNYFKGFDDFFSYLMTDGIHYLRKTDLSELNESEKIQNPEEELPDTVLKLVAFNAILEQGRAAIKWKVSDDSNAIGFSVQRSQDRINYEDLGFVPSKKEGSHYLYSFYDETPLEKGYYSLVQFDFTGINRRSLPIVCSDIKCPKIDFSLTRKENGTQFINVKLDSLEGVEMIEIIDVEGNIKQIVRLRPDPSTQIAIINIDKIKTNEVYFLNLPGQVFSEKNKFIKVPVDRRFE